MADDIDTLRFPAHRIVVNDDNIDAVRSSLPDDQHELITVGCITWRMPPDVDEWAEPMGITMVYWPQDRRGALHYDGSDDSEWGTWHGAELWLEDGFAADVTGRILRIALGEQRSSPVYTSHRNQHPDYGADHG